MQPTATHRKLGQFHVVFLSAAFGWGVAIGHAAEISPTLVFGPNAIAPPGARNSLNLTVSGAASKAALEAVADYGVNQGLWTGLTASSGTAPTATSTNYLTFTGRPDVSFNFVGEAGRNTQSGTGGAAAYTSGASSPVGGESLFFGTASTNVLTIEFGDYDPILQTFTANAGVPAAGFTFARNTAATATTTWQAEFFDGASVVSSQTINAGTAQNVAALFGYIAQPGEQITKIVLGGSGTAYDNRNHFLDDFGFAPVPEPSAVMLAGLGLATLFVRLRSRRSDSAAVAGSRR